MGFFCYDPKMQYQNGRYVNPFSDSAVKRWRKEQVILTGKPLGEIYQGTSKYVPGLGGESGLHVTEELPGRDDVIRPMTVEGR